MNRNHKDIYCFITDDNGKFYRAVQSNGSFVISKNSQPYPISYNPANLLNSELEFATNRFYNSLVRTVSYPLEFIEDGAAILRSLFINGKGEEQKAYVTIVEWNGSTGIYELSYKGRVDFKEKKDEPKTNKFTVPLVDDSAWGILSQVDDVEFAIDCTERNPKAVKVLIDGITLLNKYTYQTVQAPIINYNANNRHTIPFVLVNQDGDSSGIITKNQTLTDFSSLGDLTNSPSWFISTAYAINGVTISGSFSFIGSVLNSSNFGLGIYFRTSKAQHFPIFTAFSGIVIGHLYKIDFNITMNLAVGENVFFIAEINGNPVNQGTITPIVTNIAVSTKTKAEPQIVFGLRAIDYVQQLVSKATNNRFTINSNYLTLNNKDVITSGDAIRGVPNSKSYGSFKDFFQTFNALKFMALRNIKGEIWIEKFSDVYGNQNNNIIDLDECIDIETTCASEYSISEINVGSPKQDYRHPSGRLEVNSENIFSVPMINTKNKLDLVTKYRTGCYDIQFLILDYQGGSTQDNSGDKKNYLLNISDTKGSAVDNIETFENINVDNAPLEPIIKTPLDNDTITYDKPVIKGVAPSGSTVNIYVDNVLDGTTVSDVNGNWSYNISTALTPYVIGVTTGIHVIQATYTDLLAPNSSITLLIDTSYSTPELITYPQEGSNLYNNKPLVKGVAQAGTNIDISLNGNVIASIVADNSCKWEYKFPVIPNGANSISINAATHTVNFNVDTNVAFPLLTYIGSEIDGFILINNLPLIEGVAIPGTVVDVWLNYIQYLKLGTATADANGNWSFQVTPLVYNDPVTGTPVVLSPIRNGLSVISTSLTNHTVGIVTTGYLLNRPAFSSITGVIDNTIFNTEYSPKRMLENHYPLLASILKKQPLDKITFEKADKNGNLRTVLNGKVVSENSDVPVSSLGSPIAIMEYANIKTRTLKSFAKTLYDFNNGGVVKTKFKGTDIYMLPIGGMKMNNITSEVQEWKLLLSPLTSYIDLLNLYKSGTKISLMQNSIFHSDYNTLHLVTYNFQRNNKYNTSTIYDDWFNDRNEFWIDNPDYIQKQQKDDPFTDHIISNGVSDVVLRCYSCIDGRLITTFNYNPVVPAPIPTPEVVLRADIDMSPHDDGQYFFVLNISGTNVAISERIHFKDKWPGTILIEASHSMNKTGFFFSIGSKSVIRVEGIIKKLQPEVITDTATEENGNRNLLYSSVSRKRVVRFGTAKGLPDYLYLKIANALVLDNCAIENVLYTISQDDKISPSDDIEGVPMYYYEVMMHVSSNDKGKVFGGVGGGVDTEGIVLVIDAEAVGLPVGQLYTIQLK